MAEVVLTDAFISIAGNDVSDHFTSLSLEFTAEEQQSTAFGDEWHQREGGLKDWSISGDINADFDSGQIDQLMFAALGTKPAIVIRPDKSTALGVNNPEYRGSAVMTGYNPLGNSVGDLATGSVSLVGAGAATRHTS